VPGADRGAWYDSGVPHWIVPVRRIEEAPLEALARPLRHWPPLGRDGTNVDLVEVRGAEVLVRTFERGVEGETLACGSGLTAAGVWAAERLGLPYPVRLRTQGGDRLRLEKDADGRGLWLEGPARIVFSGRIALR
jgi:diaminopimelate epimerase